MIGKQKNEILVVTSPNKRIEKYKLPAKKFFGFTISFGDKITNYLEFDRIYE